MSSQPVVLDASALLAMLNDEPGGDHVVTVLPLAMISTVNLSEVVAKLAEHGMPEPVIQSALEGLGLRVIDFDRAMAYRCGMLRSMTKTLGLSLGDRACIALGMQRDTAVVTADRAWSQLDLGIDVRVIR